MAMPQTLAKLKAIGREIRAASASSAKLDDGHAVTAQPRRSFRIENDSFVRDGAAVTLISGSIHYTRVHPAYWKDRLMRLRVRPSSQGDSMCDSESRLRTPEDESLRLKLDLLLHMSSDAICALFRRWV